MKVSKETRQKMIDFIIENEIHWYGDLEQTDFLSDIFNLKSLPSNDGRFDNALGDISQHTSYNDDWYFDWIFSDSRFDILNCTDEQFVKFFNKIVHPLTLADSLKIKSYTSILNEIIIEEQLEYVEVKFINKIPVFEIRNIENKNYENIKFVTDIKYAIHFPVFYLSKDGWNDYFTYQTLFRLYFCKSNKNIDDVYIGNVKIMDKNNNFTSLQNVFEELNTDFCSLGQTFEYYENLKYHFPASYPSILNKLRDTAFSLDIKNTFKDLSGFKNSLIRYSEAEKVLEEAKHYLLGENKDNTFKFTFTTQIPNAEEEHKATFNFEPNNILPNRIVSIIGKNGTGKTQFLANFAKTLASDSQEKTNFNDYFQPKRPLFNRIIVVSYSAFDNFDKPKEQTYFSYKYCGIKDSNGLISEPNQEKMLKKAFEDIRKYKREHNWKKIMEEILEKRHLNYYYDKFFNNSNYDIIGEKGENILSSGHSILIRLISEVIAFIREESLIIFDEPETHLHPNIIIKLIRMIHKLLEEFNSYAVIATHSPIILQEIPSKHVIVFEREGNMPLVRGLEIESFGENIATLTEKVFNTTEVSLTYKEVLNQISEKMTYEEALQLFDNKLSFNASIYLRNLYSDK